MKGWLSGKGFGESEVEHTLVHLTKRGLQSDFRLAESIAAHYSGRNAIGRDLLRHKLQSRKLEESVIDKILARRDTEGEKDALLQAAQRKTALADRPDKIARFLASRGFGDDLIEWFLNSQEGAWTQADES